MLFQPPYTLGARSTPQQLPFRSGSQCDGVSLELANGPHLQGIALLNIPYTHGGSNLWGEHLSQKRIKRGGGPFRKGKKLKSSEKELSAHSFNSVDLSVAIQGKTFHIKYEYICVRGRGTQKNLTYFLIYSYHMPMPIQTFTRTNKHPA